jgi:hypothetical protein
MKREKILFVQIKVTQNKISDKSVEGCWVLRIFPIATQPIAGGFRGKKAANI